MNNAYHLGTVRISAIARGWHCPSCGQALLVTKRYAEVDTDHMICTPCGRAFAMPIESVMARELPYPGWTD